MPRKKFQTLDEIYERKLDLELEALTHLVRQYRVIIRRTSDRRAVAALARTGYRNAPKLLEQHLILTTTHLERAEMLIERFGDTFPTLRLMVTPA